MQRTTVHARAPKRNKPEENAPVRKRMIKLGICACILLAAVVLKNAGAAEAVSEDYFRYQRRDYGPAFHTAEWC